MGCKASTEVGNVEPLGHVCRWKKKKKKHEPREGRPVGGEARTGSTTGDPWGRYNQAIRKGDKRERPVGWGARAGSMVWDLKRSQKEAVGLQRAT